MARTRFRARTPAVWNPASSAQPGPALPLPIDEARPRNARPEPERRGGPEGRAAPGRLTSYLSGHSEDAGDEGLPTPMETEAYDDDVLVSGGRRPLGTCSPSSVPALPSQRPSAGSGSGGGDGPERPGPRGGRSGQAGLFRSRLNPLDPAHSRLRSPRHLRVRRARARRSRAWGLHGEGVHAQGADGS